MQVGNSSATSTKDKRIAFGGGAWFNSDEAHTLFQPLGNHILAKLNPVPIIHWLGYRIPDAHYSRRDTVLRPLNDAIKTIDDLLQAHPASSFDFVCHSLMGVIVTYWAYLRGQEKILNPSHPHIIDQVNTIITINSPLQGGDKYERILNILMKRDLEKTEHFQGLAIRDLREKSQVMDFLYAAYDKSPVPRFFTIATEGDRLVSLKSASIRCTQPIVITGVDDDPSDKLKSSHNVVLQHPDLLRTIEEILQPTSNTSGSLNELKTN